MDIFLSELRIAADEEEILDLENIRPGSKSICHASVQLMLDRRGTTLKTTKAKLDSCGSVSIAHVNLLNCINPARKYKLITLYKIERNRRKNENAEKSRDIKDQTTGQRML
jgi:hypothetical protein